jgi:hypothetical protein
LINVYHRHSLRMTPRIVERNLIRIFLIDQS